MTAPAPHVPHPAAGSAGSPVSALTRKLGPLPAWSYVVLVVGAAYAYRWYRARQLGSSSALTDASSPVPDPAAGTGVAMPLPVPSDGPNGTLVGATNAEWARTVSNGMVATGSNPATVSSAVSKYLAGGLLTVQEQAVIAVVIARYGFPPEGVLPVHAVPAPGPMPHPTKVPARRPLPVPVKAPPPKPVPHPGVPKPVPHPASHSYTVHAGDTLTSISHHFYGNGAGVSKIAAANHIADVNKIKAGQVLSIPV